MQSYLLRNLSELAAKRAIIIREEAQLWDILARDLRREASAEKPEAKASALPAPAAPRSSEDESNNGVLFVRIAEAARIMGIGRSSLYNEIKTSRIQIRKAGKNTLIAVADIHAWFANLPGRSGH